jgi:hypothetical protein
LSDALFKSIGHKGHWWLMPPALFFFFVLGIFEIGSQLFTQVGFELISSWSLPPE